MGRKKPRVAPPRIPGLIDSHCHLDYPPMSDDLAATLDRAANAGVEQLIHIGCRLDAFDRALALTQADPRIFAALGVHPHDATTVSDEAMRTLEDAVVANRGRVVAIGETGLDYYYDNSPREVQQQGFARHIELAQRLAMPLVLHIRDAHDDALNVVDQFPTVDNPGIVHCFTGTADEARRWLDRGYCISFSGIATFPTAAPVREAARICPNDRVMLETDAPFLAPLPNRGRKNEPAFVAFTCAHLAAERNQDAGELARFAAQNTRKLLNLPMPASA
ncbi:MAG: TatD family hydrolase [Nannocystaceae bacterium]